MLFKRNVIKNRDALNQFVFYYLYVCRLLIITNCFIGFYLVFKRTKDIFQVLSSA
jgi:hypothetical protein